MVVSFDSYFLWKIPGALGVAVFERDKQFWNLFLAKLKTAITFAPVIIMTIIIYAFGVEKNFPFYDNTPKLVGFSQTPKISRLLSFFLFFKYCCPIFQNFA